MRKGKYFLSLLLFVFINLVGTFRYILITNNERSSGKPTMTASFTFIAYFIVSILSLISSLLITKINSISDLIINRTIKLIFIITILILLILLIFFILIIFH